MLVIAEKTVCSGHQTNGGQYEENIEVPFSKQTLRFEQAQEKSRHRLIIEGQVLNAERSGEYGV
jgi:hypothetical protein